MADVVQMQVEGHKITKSYRVITVGKCRMEAVHLPGMLLAFM
jgi:hypothetical protein